MKLDYIDRHKIGWYGLLLPIKYEIDEWNKRNRKNKIRFYVKEKFGHLDISFQSEVPKYIFKMAWEAEKESMRICQLCGKRRGSVQLDDWIWTLCKQHTEARQKANESGTDNRETETRRIYSGLLISKTRKLPQTADAVASGKKKSKASGNKAVCSSSAERHKNVPPKRGKRDHSESLSAHRAGFIRATPGNAIATILGFP